MHFIDLAAQQYRIRKDIDERIAAVLNHGKYIMGPEISELESRLSEFVDCRHAIGCASGTDALLTALMANGIGPGDAVFAPPFTFVATAEVISLLGAVPVFVDIDPATFNIDPVGLERAIVALKDQDYQGYPLPVQQKTPLIPKGIIAVDLFGLCADFDQINRIADENNLFVVEDAAQSFGAEYLGKKACSLTHIGCTSFFPAKPLGCYGDGGMCFTSDDKLAETMRSVIVHGKGTEKYDNIRIGINGRLDTLQAAILLAKFEIFTEEIQERNKVAQVYTESLANLNNISIPYVKEGCLSAWAQYSLLARSIEERQLFQDSLRANNIPTAVYYPKPLHLQTAFKSLGYRPGDFPVSEDFSERIFSLPMHPYLEEKHQIEIISAIKRVSQII